MFVLLRALLTSTTLVSFYSPIKHFRTSDCTKLFQGDKEVQGRLLTKSQTFLSLKKLDCSVNPTAEREDIPAACLNIWYRD